MKNKGLLKKGRNKIFVWNGNGYKLDTITTNKKELNIEEVAYICIKSNKGLFKTIEESDNDYYEDESYYYCDLSSYGLENGFLLIENLYSNEVIIYG